MKKHLYFIIIGIVCIVSFGLYASMFYPALNADNGVTVLMTYYFKLPRDFYCWGLDRFGSFIPLLGQIPLKIFHLSALTSESIAHYTILLMGLLAFLSFIKSPFYKVVFSIVWFLPPMHLIDVTQFAFGIHYSLIAMACYLFKISTRKYEEIHNF